MQISSPSSTSLFDTLSENLLSKKTNETEGSSFDSLIERKEDSSVIIHKETDESSSFFSKESKEEPSVSFVLFVKRFSLEVLNNDVEVVDDICIFYPFYEMT